MLSFFLSSKLFILFVLSVIIMTKTTSPLPPVSYSFPVEEVENLIGRFGGAICLVHGYTILIFIVHVVNVIVQGSV